MAAPDLSGAQRAVEQLLTDTCRITIDRDGIDDATLDPDTGELVEPDDNAALYRGPVLVSKVASGFRAGQSGGELVAPTSNAAYEALVPLAAPVLPEGAMLTVLTARRDRQLVGQRFRVLDAGELGTYAVVRKVPLEVAT